MSKTTSTLVVVSSAIALVSCGSPSAEPTSDEDSSPNIGQSALEAAKAQPVAEVPTIDAGLSVGSKAPADAKFRTTEGESSLAQLLDDGPAVLIFTRSVEWCPFCQTQLKGVNGIVGDLEERGYRIYGVSYDSVESQDRFSKNQMLNYKMLSDEKSKAIDAFGLRDPQYTEGKPVGVPYASVIVINKDGVITAKSVSGDFRKRPTNEQILEIVDAV